MLKPTLFIFAKAPAPGRVKTRLARSIGDDAACGVYVELLARTIDALADAPAWRTVLAVTPDDAVATDAVWPRATLRAPQGDGDLGARMHRALATARRGLPVVIVGSDIADIAARHVAEAFDALDRHDLVIGPAVDGGYWLIGTAEAPPPDLFDGVRWSSPFALADTIANVRGMTVARLASCLEDVDDAESYARFLRRAGRHP